MKRIFSICVAVMLMMTMLTIVPLSSSAAAEPAKLLDFYEEYLFNEHSSSGEHDVAVSWKDHAMDIVALTENTEKSDPYFTVVSSGGFSADDNQWTFIPYREVRLPILIFPQRIPILRHMWLIFLRQTLTLLMSSTAPAV